MGHCFCWDEGNLTFSIDMYIYYCVIESILGHRDGISLAYKLNRSGPNVDPCETPVEELRAVDWWLSTQTI